MNVLIACTLFNNIYDDDLINRYNNISKELSKDFKVSLFISKEKYSKIFKEENFEILDSDTINFSKAISDKNIFITNGITAQNSSYLKNIKVPIVIDLYKMYLFNSESNYMNTNRAYLNKDSLNLLRKILVLGDHFIFENINNKNYWFGMLASYSRLNPYNYGEDNALKNLLSHVPDDFSEENIVDLKEFIRRNRKSADKMHRYNKNKGAVVN